MAITKLKLFRINANLTDLNQVLEQFVSLECVHPIKASEFIGSVHGLTAFKSDNPYYNIYKELTDLEKESDYTISAIEISQIDDSYENMINYISSIHKNLKKLSLHRKEVEVLIKKYQDALFQIKNIEDLDISLDDLFSVKYVSVRVGKLPIDSVEKLQFYNNKPFIFKPFHEEQNFSWCMYLTPNKYEREIDNIFSSLFFERIHIPDFVHGTPESAETSLSREIEVAKSNLKETLVEIDDIFNENLDRLSVIKGELTLLNKIYNARKYVAGIGEKIIITGFISKRDKSILIKKYKSLKSVEVELMPADSDRRIKPPTKLKNNWFTRPFASFVKMYGLPEYFGIDPTPVLALTYTLLFGIMFGDLGQGLVVVLLGVLIYKKYKLTLAAIAVRIGISSMFFGLLYGSFFGNEEILTPVFENIFGFKGKPIDVMDPSFTMTLLIATVGLGSLLIVTAMILNMISSGKKKNYAELFFSPNGLAGLIFYLFVIGGSVISMTGTISLFNPLTIILFIILPLILIVLKEPLDRLIKREKMFPDKIGEFFVEGFFELFEVLLSYITNTLSFLRVGGFLLVHAGMMLVVYTLMDMTSVAAYQIIILVLGNIFVMGVEGLVVGIQVLRLEFYEMFSRYFEGKGLPFETFE